MLKVSGYLVKLFLVFVLFLAFPFQKQIEAAPNELTTVTVYKAAWKGDPNIVDGQYIKADVLLFIIEKVNKSDGEQKSEFLNRASRNFTLIADGYDDVYATAAGGFSNSIGEHGFSLEIDNPEKVVSGVNYKIVANNTNDTYKWNVIENVAVSKYEEDVTKTVPSPTNTFQIDHIEVTEQEFTLAPGESQRFQVYAIDKNGREKNITFNEGTTYRSESSSLVEVKPGNVKASKKEGKTRINISYDGKKITLPVTVAKANVVSLAASLKETTIESGETEQITLMATYSDKTVKDVTSLAVWMTDNSRVVTVDSGEIEGKKEGRATVTAQFGGVKKEIIVEVNEPTAPELIGLEASDKNIKIQVEQEKIIKIYAVYDDGSKEEVTDEILWKSNKSSVVEVEDGVLIGNAVGKGIISVTFNKKTININVEVFKEKKIKSLTASLTKVSLKVGAKKQLKLTVTYVDGTKEDVTDEADWIIKNTKVADAQEGLVKGIGKGNTTITAKYKGKYVNIAVGVTK